jgi:hypothetical protein
MLIARKLIQWLEIDIEGLPCATSVFVFGVTVPLVTEFLSLIYCNIQLYALPTCRWRCIAPGRFDGFMASKRSHILNIHALIDQAFAEGMAQAMGRYFFVV